jgi:glucosyl-3-phosphoglycerate synthase
VETWFRTNSYEHAQFADLETLARHKRERAIELSVVLPAREVAATIGPILDAIRALDERAPLIDQLVVVDASSADGTAELAAAHGAEVFDESELIPGLGPVLGKGDAMWRALSVARGDVVMYLDSDTSDFEQCFIYGLLGPLVESPELSFVKAAYNRPLAGGLGQEGASSGRVTELTARPLLNLFYPELAGFSQPLAGELAGRRELLCSIPYFTGYAVETGMLIDILDAAGLERMAQVDLGTRTNRSQDLFALSRMSFEVLRAVVQRLRDDGRLRAAEQAAAEDYLQAIRTEESLRLDRTSVPVVERPPLAEVL